MPRGCNNNNRERRTTIRQYKNYLMQGSYLEVGYGAGCMSRRRPKETWGQKHRRWKKRKKNCLQYNAVWTLWCTRVLKNLGGRNRGEGGGMRALHSSMRHVVQSNAPWVMWWRDVVNYEGSYCGGSRQGLWRRVLYNLESKGGRRQRIARSAILMRIK